MPLWSNGGERERFAGLVHRMLDDFGAHRDRLDAGTVPNGP
ncbi:hypothetical protein [Actinomadura graeca]|nr:hypothetical protein [Actinomadura graeca]